LLKSLDFSDVAIVDGDGRMATPIAAPDVERSGAIAPLLPGLRAQATAAGGRVVFTDLVMLGGRPVFFLLRDLGEGRLGVGVLTTRFIVAQQQKIAFGSGGHSLIVDRAGRVIAHPDADWRASAKDLSPLGVMRAMMAGGSGVARFLSPATRADMIAGYAAVSGVGWGVMVAQPMSELLARAHGVAVMAGMVTLFSLLGAAFLGSRLATVLARPIERVAQVAESVAHGDTAARIRDTARIVPEEARRLGDTVNRMVATLGERNGALAHAAAHAEAANRAKSAFLANMSHEFRTPLNAIIGFSECMRDEIFGGLGNPRYASYAADIHASGKHLLRVVNDILDLSKAEAGHIEVRPAPVDVGDLAEMALRMVEQRARQGGLALGRRIDPTLERASVVSDEGKLLQILLNLLSNAVKFTPEGGAVSLEVTAPDADTIRFTVRDTGVGIDAKDLPRMMEPFVQAAGAFHSHEGTGLGLPLAKKLTESLGGTLRLESAPGAGTTATIDLPRIPPALAAAA
jgi:signal transduction histidine kinase